MSHKALNPRQFFHVAPREARESIMEHGLHYDLGQSPHESYYAHTPRPRGNYLFGNEDAAWEHKDIHDELARDEGGEWSPRDVWRVRHKGVVHKDPDSDKPKHRSVYTTAHIPPTKLKLLTDDD